MEYKDFENKIGAIFTTRAQGREISLTLTHVDKLEPILPEGYTGPKPDSYIETPFRLTFCGPADIVLQSQIHDLTDKNDALYSIFLSAFLQNSEGIFYEAIFK